MALERVVGSLSMEGLKMNLKEISEMNTIGYYGVF